MEWERLVWYLAASAALLSVFGLVEDSGCDLNRVEPERRPSLPPYPSTSVAMIGFVGREGSSWLLSLLRATQIHSKTGKICVLGYEPIEGLNSPLNESERDRIRKDFLMAFAEPPEPNQTDPEQKLEDWLGRLRSILGRGGFGDKLPDPCHHSSRLFIFKARLGIRFQTERLASDDFRWFAEFSRKLERSNGKFILLRRYDVLQHEAVPSNNQFLLKHASTEEERQGILDMNANVTVDPKQTRLRADKYRRLTASIAKFATLLKVPTSSLYYERLVEDYETEFRRLLRFLEVPVDYNPTVLLSEGTFEKASPSRLCQKVSNYQEFCDYFEATPFAGFLEEPCNTTCSS